MYKIEFNGYTLENDANVNISKLDGLDRVPVRVSEDNLTGAHGGNIWERRYGMRTVLIGGEIYADDFTTYYNLRRQLLQTFDISTASTELKITRPDGIVKVVNAKVIDIPIFVESPGEFAEARFEIVLKCDNPFWLSETETIYTTGLAETGGTPVSSPIPSPVGSPSGNTITITNDGDLAGKVVFDIFGPVNTPTVTNLTTLKQFQIDRTIVSGESISVYKDQTGENVILNGSTNIYSDFTGVIFDIPVGTTKIKFTALAVNDTAILQITFTERFLTL